MNMIIHELKAMKKSLLFWNLGVIILLVAGMAKYEGAANSGQDFNAIIDSLPKAIRAFMGVGELDVSTAGGYYGVLFTYLLLMGTIYAAILGGTILSKEATDKTIEFLFVRPISRRKVITNKIIAALLGISLFNGVSLGTSVGIVAHYNEHQSVTDKIIMLTIGLLLLQLLFFFLALVISASSRNQRIGTSITTTTIMGSFLLSIAIDLSEKIEFLTIFTPLKYFEAKNILLGEGLNPLYSSICLLVSICCLLFTYRNYEKRDLL